MVAEQCTSQLDPGKEKASTQGPGCAVWVEQLLQGELFPPKPLRLLILRKWDYCLSSTKMKNCLYLQAVCLFREHSLPLDNTHEGEFWESNSFGFFSYFHFFSSLQMTCNFNF